MSRWQRYWFAEGGRTAAAIVRIAIATAVLLTLARLDNAVSTGSATLYRPVGLWMLFGHTHPPEAVTTILWVVAWTSTACMLLGAATRASTALSFVSAVMLASLSFSSGKTWSHQYNVVFLAQLAFLGARGGDVLSIDWLVRRWRGLPPIDLPRAYQWSLRLVQLAVALMFAGAVFHKLAHGQFTLRWALSDNLRHHLLVRFDLAGLARPPLVDWIIDDPWKYRTAAVLNLISQALPLAAVFLVKRPILRALAGGFFVIETVALGLVVDLWNLHWLPLAAVFVDWDRLLRRTAVPATPAGWRPSRAIRIWLVAFIVYDVLTAFVPTLDQRLNTYPFSGFPMFSTIRVREPYYEHQAYGVAADSFEVTSDQPMRPDAQRWFDHANRGAFLARDPDDLERRLRAVLANGQRRFPELGIRGVRLWLAIYEAPAWPAPAHFERHRIAVVGELLPDGTFRTALGKVQMEPGVVTLAPRNLELEGASACYVRDDRPAPIALAAKVMANRLELGTERVGGNPIYFVATANEVPWLVARHAPWRWQ